MTFQEALAVIYAVDDTYDRGTYWEAVGALHFFNENVLELEDYETDQLYKALNHIKTMEAKKYE